MCNPAVLGKDEIEYRGHVYRVVEHTDDTPDCIGCAFADRDCTSPELECRAKCRPDRREVHYVHVRSATAAVASDFCVVHECSIPTMEARVKDLMAAGWRLAGGIAISPKGWACQAMYKPGNK